MDQSISGLMYIGKANVVSKIVQLAQLQPLVLLIIRPGCIVAQPGNACLEKDDNGHNLHVLSRKRF